MGYLVTVWQPSLMVLHEHDDYGYFQGVKGPELKIIVKGSLRYYLQHLILKDNHIN